MKKLTKKEHERYTELMEKAMDNYLRDSEFYVADFLPPMEAEEFEKLNDRLIKEGV